MAAEVAAGCFAFPDRRPVCLEPQVQQVQQELIDERRERQSALHDEKKEREETNHVILTLGNWIDLLGLAEVVRRC